MKPTPTPEMIEAGARAIAKLMAEKRNEIYRLQGREKLVLTDEEIANSVERSWRLHKDDTEAALSAALSVQPEAAVVGEAVAWTTETNLTVAKHDPKLALTMWGSPNGKEPVALYREPPAAPSAPEGWVLVPIESTNKMDVAGVLALRERAMDCSGVWEAMIAAAPSPPSTHSNDKGRENK